MHHYSLNFLFLFREQARNNLLAFAINHHSRLNTRSNFPNSMKYNSKLVKNVLNMICKVTEEEQKQARNFSRSFRDHPSYLRPEK